MDTIYNLIQTVVAGIAYARAKTPIFERSAAQAVASSVAGIAAAVTDNGSARTGLAVTGTPPCPRNATATSGGTSADIKAVAVTVRGKRNGVVISETLPVFTVNTPTTVQGSKIFDEFTDWDVPAHDGTGATTSLGWGDKLGLDVLLPRNTVVAAHLNNVRETTAPTVGYSATNLESNYILLNSALDGHAVHAYFHVNS